MRRNLRVRDLMTDDVYTLKPSDTLASAYDLMDTRHVRHIPVVDREGDLQGLVTHRDLMRGAFGASSVRPVSSQRDLLSQSFVEEIMQVDVETVEPDALLKDAAQIILENKFGCLPVVEGASLVGILTEADFVRFVADWLADQE